MALLLDFIDYNPKCNWTICFHSHYPFHYRVTTESNCSLLKMSAFIIEQKKFSFRRISAIEREIEKNRLVRLRTIKIATESQGLDVSIS